MKLTCGMVLAAGLGTRMRPITDRIPKPLVAVAGRTLLDRALDQLERHGIECAVVNVSYKAEQIVEHLKDRASPAIQLSHEASPLETGGGISQALPLLGTQPFVSLNSDTICLDGAVPALQRMQDAWDDTAMDILMLLHPREQAVGYDGEGDFVRAEDGAIRRRHADELAPYVFTGVQILHPKLFEHAPQGAFSMNVIYNQMQQSDGRLARIGVVIHDGAWLHVGDPEGLRQAEAYLHMIKA